MIVNKNTSCVPDAFRKAAYAHFRLLKKYDCFISLCIDNSPDFTICDSHQPLKAEYLSVCCALSIFNCVVKKNTGKLVH